MKSMHNEVYPELTSVLQRFVVGVQNALGSNFLGAYLVGSLATGDFDLDSDVDFMRASAKLGHSAPRKRCAAAE
jgi:hypothetical protein